MKTLILGYNKKQPFLGGEELQAMGVEELILLPSIKESMLECPEGVRVQHAPPNHYVKAPLK